MSLVGASALLLLLAACLVTRPGVAEAQERTDSTLVSVELEVIDQDSGQPVENAVVRIPELSTYLLTDSLGRASLTDIEVGSYGLVLTRMGYQAERGEFRVDRGGSFRIPLTPILIRADAGPGDVRGRVTAAESGDVLVGAVVSIAEGALRRVSDANGRFVFEGVPSGRHLIEIEHLGRQTLRDSILVMDDQELEVEAPLPIEAIELEGLTVTSHSRALTRSGFFRRRQAAGAFRGRQWTREDLEERDPVYLQHILVEIPAVRRRVPAAGEGTNISLIAGRGCRLAIYVDDFKMDPWFDLDHIEPRRVEALEVYHGTPMPSRYLRECGVILVWLKRRSTDR
jgi:hypothetical protein